MRQDMGTLELIVEITKRRKVRLDTRRPRASTCIVYVVNLRLSMDKFIEHEVEAWTVRSDGSAGSADSKVPQVRSGPDVY